ncbi:hypothetical protein KAFR_0F00390 [Kazachstania africana CBS 2517]|uniref:RRM domain-containing protein n=1 Tax=Kazachstania africana (strain ATCC 22294 / BCRC 22015 / CBS 2517 / CECT 1963 / NBRC 1671 / NRRL Y-8276) TaxID=1071382 RepID=H2AW86_KAZAF|nr:hypothetical protein KAFR_0F00390 [Kazachstania africana CBS 2517]CCF58636.1 hypothetical protein KAFR_0F00390 [Kazachstania africana CBS 2517]
MSEKPKQLTKKQQKALEFRKTKEEKEQESQKRTNEELNPSTNDPPKKKRKTRRGRKGKGRRDDSSRANRFLIFVGGLPRDVTSTELQAHFKSSAPDQIRIRQDKGIAFLEFDGDKDPKTIQRRMDVALLQHRTSIRDKKINVELTVGGGGNSQQRLEKLKNKNLKFEEERRERLTKLIKEGGLKKPESGSTSTATTAQGLHPDRAKLLQ